MKIALDVDEVLAGFMPALFKELNIKLRKCNNWCQETMDGICGVGWFDRVRFNKSFWRNLPTISKPEDIDFDFDYYISSFPPEMYDERVAWLKENGFPNKPLICSFDKVETCKNLGVDLLIDDKPQTIMACHEAGIKTLHFIPSYSDFPTMGRGITNLNQVKSHLEKWQ